MEFSSALTTAELEISKTSSWSVVSKLDSLHRFSFQFIINGNASMYIDRVVYENGGESSCKLK